MLGSSTSKPHYEIWSSLEWQVRWWRNVGLATLLLMAVLIVSFVRLWQQSVVVVRLPGDGKTDVEWATPAKNGVTQEEIIDFVEEFLKVYLAPSSDRVVQNLQRAMAMMSAALKERHAQFNKQSDYVKRVQAMNVETELSFTNILVEPKEAGVFNVFAAGQQRTMTHAGGAVFHPFKGMVVLKRIARSKFNPYGLEVAYLDYEIKSN